MRALLSAVLTLAPFGCFAIAAPTESCAYDIAHENITCEMAPAAISSATQTGLVIKGTGGILVSANLNNWATATGVTVMAVDSPTAPANGAILPCNYGNSNPRTTGCVIAWWGVPAATSAAQPGTVSLFWQPGPFLRFYSGLTLLCSTTGPLTVTLAADCTFSAMVQ